MKTLLLHLFMSAILFFPACTEGSDKTPEKVLPLLGTLKNDAIEIGNGARDAYVFIDPKCLKSRDFLDTITTNATLLKLYHYYIFLYDMPAVSSETVINAVYAAARPKEAMFTYMLERKRIAKERGELPPPVLKRIKRIRNAAVQIGINKTPYLIVDKTENR